MFYGVALILLSALVFLIKIAFTPANNLPKSNIVVPPTVSPKTVDLCDPYDAVKSKISCREAVKKATADTKGKVERITIGPPNPIIFKVKIPISPTTEMWIIDIKLEKPYMSPEGKKIVSLQIGMPTDGTDMLYRLPN
jgi:hypothetical protein